MTFRILFALIVVALGASIASAQAKKLAIGDVKAGPGLVKSATKNDTVVSLERVVQAFDSQLIDRLQGTRKFQIIARSDLKQLDKDDAVGQQGFKVPSADYLLVTTLDDFQDFQESLTLPTTGEKLTKRVIRVTAVAKIYDAVKGALVESASITLSIPETAAQFNSSRNGDLSDELLQKVVSQIADATANRVADVIYPAKIISRSDKQVTINRGDGTAIAAGQVWDVFALGKELRDPDTGELLDRERLQVGRIRITRVNPKTSMAEVLEDTGIVEGAIVQPPAK